MIEMRHDLDLTQKSRGADHRRKLRQQYLDGDAPIVPPFSREVDDSHAPSADLAGDVIAVGEASLQSDEEIVSLDHSGRTLPVTGPSLRLEERHECLGWLLEIRGEQRQTYLPFVQRVRELGITGAGGSRAARSASCQARSSHTDAPVYRKCLRSA